jgi:hypothetical protein
MDITPKQRDDALSAALTLLGVMAQQVDTLGKILAAMKSDYVPPPPAPKK